MGFWRKVFALTDSVEQINASAASAASFAVDADAIDPAVFGITSYATPTAPAPRIDRRTAIQVGAVKRCRDLVPGVLGTLPWTFVAPDKTTVAAMPGDLLAQPERNVPRAVTFTRLFEDLYFEQIAWWHVTEFAWNNYPKYVERMHPRHVTVEEGTGRVYWRGKLMRDDELIRFDAPTDGLLFSAARAIRTHLMLDAAHSNMVDGVPPIDYFTPAEGVDPAEDDDVVALLDAWQEARRLRTTGYVPAALKYNTGGWSPKDLLLGEARQECVLEIARHAGVDPEELGVSTTSRTYANQFDRRKQFTDFTLRLFFVAVQDRLSMGDVCPRGYTARINLAELFQSDPAARYAAYEVGLRVGAITPEQIAELEGNPTVNEPQSNAPAAPADTAGTDAPAATATAGATFDTAAPELRLAAPVTAATTFEVDRETRVIRGLMVPYGVPAESGGARWQFSQGTLKYADPSRVKLWVQHDPNRAVGFAMELEDKPEGMFGAFKVARGAAGDEALTMAEDGVWDGLSIGIAAGGKFRTAAGVNHAVSAPLMETSLTPAPAFDDARVHSVAASAARNTEGNNMPETTATEETAAPVDFSAVTEAVRDGIATAFADLRNPQEGRETIAAGGGLESVSEPSPYRFDGMAGAHSFSQDIMGMASGDTEARQRVEEFMETAFAVTTGNVGTLNPTQNRPDLYVPNLTFSTPLWDLVSNGAITDRTPFTVPKFGSAAGLVGAHTEGVEPTPGTFTAQAQTITPGALSGKVEINREVMDAGGSPQADAIIWGEMLNAWFEAREAKIAAALKAVPTAEINLAGAVDGPLVDAVENIFVNLQFARGGNRFTAFAADGKLFPALVNAKDSTGRKLLPVVNPSNADGSTEGNFSAVQIGTQKAAAAWALGAGNDAQSYLFVPSSVWAWASAPRKFTFEYQVKSIDMAIWGYSATAVLRDSDVKPIDYTTADV